jgi:hypothetical protein
MLDAIPFWFDAAVFAALSFAILQLSKLGRCVMATQADVDKLVTQVIKVRGEIQNIKSELGSVKEQLANAGVAEKIDLSGLEAAIQAADDENVDPVVEPADPEPVVDEPVVEDSPVE